MHVCMNLCIYIYIYVYTSYIYMIYIYIYHIYIHIIYIYNTSYIYTHTSYIYTSYIYMYIYMQMYTSTNVYKYKCICTSRIVYTVYISLYSLPVRKIPLHSQVMLCGKPPFWGNYNEQLRRSGVGVHQASTPPAALRRGLKNRQKVLNKSEISEFNIIYNIISCKSILVFSLQQLYAPVKLTELLKICHYSRNIISGETSIPTINHDWGLS